jgi:hypothetical protein
VLKIIDIQQAEVVKNFKIGTILSEDDTLARQKVGYKHLMFIYN